MKKSSLYLPAILLFSFVIFCSSCQSETREPLPDTPFNKTQWHAPGEEKYKYRPQMVNDILNNYKWEGVSQDSVIRMLGEPDVKEKDILMFTYEKTSFLGGIGTAHEGISFELNPDGTVKLARLSDGGFD